MCSHESPLAATGMAIRRACRRPGDRSQPGRPEAGAKRRQVVLAATADKLGDGLRMSWQQAS